MKSSLMAVFVGNWQLYIRVALSSQVLHKLDNGCHRMVRNEIMISKFRSFFSIFAAVLMSAPVIDVWAGGYLIPHQTARGVSLSNAITAGVNDASAVYYNPAALSEVNGDKVLASGSYVNVSNSVENSGRKSRNKHDDNFLATFFANYHIPGTDFTLGIGTYTPFGLVTTYDSDAFTRFAAVQTQLKTIYVTPALSWNPTNYLSLGAGLSFVHASGVFSRALCLDPISFCTQPLGLEGTVRLTDTDDAFAYNIGLLVKPIETLKFGFSYRS